jgi:hypothetical protein
MSDERTDKTLTARSSQPAARPYEVGGMSAMMKKRLDESGVHESIKQKIAEHLAKIKGG